MKSNLVVLVSRIITRYIDGLVVLPKSVPQHIQHKYSMEMGKKSEVIVLDVLMNDEANRSDMIDIIKCMRTTSARNTPVREGCCQEEIS